MRRLAYAVAVVAALSVSGSAPASPFTGAFEALLTEIENKGDELTGDLDPVQKKQLKALAKCSALLEKDSGSPYEDMKIYAAVATQLGKAYPDEALVTSSTPLAQALFGALDTLYTEFVGDYGPFKDTAAKMVPDAKGRKAAKLVAAADKAKANIGPESTFAAAGKAYVKSWKSVLKGIPLTEGAVLLPAPTLAFNVDGTESSGGTVAWAYHSRSRKIEVFLNHDDGNGNYVTVQLRGDVDPASSTVTPTGGNAEVSVDYNSDYFDVEGLQLTGVVLDLKGHAFSADFSFSGVGLKEYTVSGSFAASWYLEIVND